MAGMPGRSGRKPFIPTPEQRSNVNTLAGLGMPQEQICRLVTNPQSRQAAGCEVAEKAFRAGD
jgi:hypothetical protein